jgi:hypothetical protein
MDGLKLLHAVRRRWPPLVLILASGRLAPKVEEMPSKTVVLRKPYREDDLISVIREAA